MMNRVIGNMNQGHVAKSIMRINSAGFIGPCAVPMMQTGSITTDQRTEMTSQARFIMSFSSNASMNLANERRNSKSVLYT